MIRKGRFIFLLLASLVLVVDQASKAFMTHLLASRGSIPVIPGLFDLTYVRNRGAVFGLFRDLPDLWRAPLLTLVPVAALVFVLVAVYHTPAHRFLPLSAFGLVLGGALGNLSDRIRFQSVVDFLDVYLGRYHWPAFNVADSAICVGVALLILDLLRAARPQSAQTPMAGGQETPLPGARSRK
ncbi:MAG: signal peptidase II [Acidobacteriota bacterium]